MENDTITPVIMNDNSINSKRDLLMVSLSKFFSNQDNLSKMIPIITGKSKISLRILDWFVTNYCKKYNVRYEIDLPNNKKKLFIVYLEYKNNLKAFSKQLLDPFNRRQRLLMIDKNGNEIITTVGQLNFFRWALENDIIKYVTENHAHIEEDMNASLKRTDNKNNDNKKRRKKTPLSISAVKSINKHNISITIQFD